MGLIEERGEGQPKHEGGRGDESPGEQEELQQRSKQPEFPSWQVSFSTQTVPRKGWAGNRGLLAVGSWCVGRMGWEGCCQVPREGSRDGAGDRQRGACIGNLMV